ncbi:MAG: hypothetical protein LBF75_04775 [Treponema sp.]|jgi:hypothetical protein|nr:hypothetical protein [Treponema sp.]
MRYVSVELFQRYCGVCENPELLKTYIDAAQNMVAAYLGYDPEYVQYTTVVSGSGTAQLSLQAKPIQAILEVLIDGEVIPSGQFSTCNEFLYRKHGTFPEGSRVIVTYGAGYSAGDHEDKGEADGIIDGGDAATVYDDTAEALDASGALVLTPMPYIIKLTVLRIAALLQAESDSNIGITSKSFAESGSRTFMNYTNFDKYLLPIAGYKLLVV